jgi:hypothetical protein
MKSEPRYDGSGETIGEYLALAAYELEDDGTVGMWKIVPAGRQSFGLIGLELDAFVRRYIAALMNAGAKPVRAVDLPNNMWEWREQTQFGNDIESIAQAIVAEWRAAGAPDPEWGWLRFELSQYVNIPCRRNQSPRATGL